MIKLRYVLNTLPLLIFLVSCTGSNTRYAMVQDRAPTFHIDVKNIPDAKPKNEPKSKLGNPKSYVIDGKKYHVMASNKNYQATGMASWYGIKFQGHTTSNGERYDVAKMTAAHPTLPLPTYLKVTNLKNGKQVIVKVNDRGPFAKGRLLDLSYAAAKKLGMTGHGTTLVKVAAIDTDYLASAPKLASKDKKVYLQVGAYKLLENAQRQKTHIAALTKHNCKIQHDKLTNSAPVYRVKVGPIVNVALANKISNKLSNVGLKPMVVTESA